jgi:Holliday junction resolvase RusA-like endonuclease
MTMIIYETVVPKQRPRRGKGGFFYTPKKTVDFENLIGEYGQVYAHENCIHPNHSKDKGIRVSIDYYVKIPKSWSKKKKEQALLGEIRPKCKPDNDNVEKSLYDGLESILWHNDSEIVENKTRKFYAEEPRIEINVEYL